MLLLSLPTLLWYLAFCYLPMFGIVIAFKRYRMVPGKGFLFSLFFGSDWVGGNGAAGHAGDSAILSSFRAASLCFPDSDVAASLSLLDHRELFRLFLPFRG